MLFLFKVIHPCKIAVHFRDPFLVIGLVVPAPVRQFLFVPERFPPALPAHDHVHLRGQFPDERSDSPSFPDVSVHIDFCCHIVFRFKSFLLYFQVEALLLRTFD